MELSGGLRQRAMIAMALICHPALLIADEPTTALDVSMQAKILSLLKELQDKLGMAVLLITHDLGVVANMADEVVVMYHGQIMEAGPREAIFRNPQHQYLKALLNAVPDLSMGYDEKLQSLRDIDHEIPPSMIGEITERKTHADEVLLKVRGLRKEFTTKKSSGWFGSSANVLKAVDDVSFDVRRGECFGLVGESGCGKTTTLKMIVRALSATGGSVEWLEGDGKEQSVVDLLGLDNEGVKAFRRKIQMVFQDPFSSLSPRSTVLNILKEPMEVHSMGSKKEQAEYAAELMRLVGLQPTFLGRYPHSFSGGQRQRIGIARALALRPELLVCDEPVSALDVSVQAQALNLLKQLQEELGLTYIFISHNLAVVRYIADRIGVMFKGQLVEMATREELFENPVHPYTRALLDVVPHADLDHPLDFDRINRDMASEGRNWSFPFASQTDGTDMEMISITANHQVRVIAGSDPATLSKAS
jgi:peptide/nickel transport system ATP-binding protein